MNEKKFLTTKRMTLIALVTAITCVVGPLAIPLPFSPVPITWTNFILYLSGYVLGCQAGTISYILYLLLGLVGLPVFSGFAGGLGKLAGPTGGYLFGFIFTILIVGFVCDKFPKNVAVQIAGMIAGLAICYIFGTMWLAKGLGRTFTEALAIGVLPYLIGDTVKIVAAAIVGPQLKKRISRL